MGAAGAGRRSHLTVPSITADNLPTWLFGALVAVAGPLLVFHYGAYHWFLRDDWLFLAEEDPWYTNLFEPQGGAHLVALPRVVFAAMWNFFGITTYRPYQAFAVAAHLAVAVQLRLVMRRAGVRPWLAAAAAGSFVLCGPGATNTIWAFQIGFTGSVAFGLAQLLTADHDGPIGRRDALALGFGFLAILSSAIGITTTVAVAAALLLRRGWRAAAVQSAPLAIAYGAWVVLTDASATGPFGTPSLGELSAWVWSLAIGTFQAVGRFDFMAWVFLALLVAALVVVLSPARRPQLGDLRQAAALPMGLALGAVFFAWTTGLGRAWGGPESARVDRYVYLGAALLLPLLALAAECLAARWRALTPALVALFLLAVPFNLGGIDAGVFDEQYMDRRQEIYTTAVRMPFAREVPRDVRPDPDPFASDGLTIGFLLTAEADGRLTPSTMPLTPEVINEFKVRLGVAQRVDPERVVDCRTYDAPITIDPAVGDQLHLGSDVAIATIEDGRRTSRSVVRRPLLGGTELTVELPDLHLWVGPRPGATTFRLCQAG